MSKMRKTLMALGLLAISLSCITFGLEATGHFALETALVNGEALSAAEANNLGLRIGESVFQQDCKVAAEVMCRREGIGVADIKIQLPNKIVITTNDYTPVLLVYDAIGMRLLGVDNRSCVTPPPTKTALSEYVGPTIMGLKGLELYKKPIDFRLITVARALALLKENNAQWYASISEIDFSRNDCLRITVDGFDFVTLAPVDGLYWALETLFRMAQGSPEALANVAKADLRFTGQIVITPNATNALKTKTTK